RDAAQRARRFRLSAIPFARRSDRLRKSRDPAVVSKGEQTRTGRTRGRCAGPLSNGGEEGFVSASAFRRPTAACRRRTGDHCQSEINFGGRTNRKSSLESG